ncbi:MAG: T9SS type A sorting domain-containing protein [Bacteroidetes bacterium]|nr:T9SS type A sorting domain-containing protein [Bacteroidota bacterium]
MSFYSSGMDGQQFKASSTPPYNTVYNIPNSYENNLSGIYYGRIYCAAAFNLHSYGPWTQWDGTVNWNTAVNTSVWDYGTAPAEITNTGSKALALRIHPGAQLKINVGADLTCTGNTEINGAEGLKISSDAGGAGSFIDNGTISYPNSGSATVERYLTTCVGSTGSSCWHYVASPLTSAVSNVFLGDYLRWYNTSIGAWSSEYTQTNYPLTVMKGFAISEQGSVGPNFHTNHYFTGVLNTEASTYPLALTGTTGGGYNLVGNPYPSAIDIEAAGIAWTNVASKVWYLEKSSGTYLAYPKGGAGATGSQFIPPMQAFFVYANAASASVTFPNSARVHNNSVPFYKEAQAPNDVDVLYLKAQGNGRESYDLASVVFRDYATRKYDDAYDAQKIYGDAQTPQLYTLSEDNVNLTINSLPYTDKSATIPLNLQIFENGTGSYAVTASNLQSFRSGTIITLEDKKEAKTQELTSNPVYNFTYTDGDAPARFLLHFMNPYFGIDDAGKNNMLVYSYKHDVYVKDRSGNPRAGQLYLYNMMGQEIARKPVANIQLNKFTFDLPEGYYVVRVITNDNTYNAKVYLN